MNYYKRDITLVRGDTFSNTIIVEDLGQDLEEIKFTCKSGLNDDSDTIFEKELNDGITLIDYNEEEDIRKYAIRVPPEDTKDVQSGTYYYDIRIKVNFDIFTIMKGKLILVQSCGGDIYE